jgi:hypothetical protein
MKIYELRIEMGTCIELMNGSPQARHGYIQLCGPCVAALMEIVGAMADASTVSVNIYIDPWL